MPDAPPPPTRSFINHGHLTTPRNATWRAVLLSGGAVVYNGDAVRNIMDDKFTYTVPKEGGILWVDNLLICAKAPNKAGGEKFINHILDAKVGAQLSNFNRYATPNQASLPLIAEADQKNSAIYPSAAQMKTCQFQEDVGAETKIYDQVWTSVKAR